ncbi:heparinase II/III family protein [Haloferula sp. BvORR071]|uniref:heparinase II/III domain-containing protein n=1 Tax=Haloferula sp. BvORR071 TaxID=1396141 RepID=UPI00054E62AB|nr:heparinase II/III family protein [Haloferula sp. BvORR071]
MRFLFPLLASVVVAHADPHPRLMFPPAAEAELKQRLAGDPLAERLQKYALGKAENVLKERTCKYELADKIRLLPESRRALEQVSYSAWAWRTTGEERFKERTIRELDAACALQDWNPSHFLDVAEMATAVAIGYDWLYPALSPEQRQRYEDALLDKALRVVGPRHAKTGWWRGATNNWTQVCACGMALAAEAVRERDPELCQGIIEHGRELIEKCSAFYAPDGCYPEGPAYWHYGTNFEVMLIAARQSLGQPIEVTPLLRDSGNFLIQAHGPTGLSFNYADSGPGSEQLSPARSWIATQFKDAGQARYIREKFEKELNGGKISGFRTFPLHLLWLPPAPQEGQGSKEAPLNASFGGEQAMAFMRNGWTPDSAWLAIKGGTGAASHGHLDAGSFVYEAGGQRWFHDLGSDDYNMPGYFGNKRWSYLRLNNFSHNTLVIDGKNQKTPEEGCPILVQPRPLEEAPGARAKAGQARINTSIDLSGAYSGQAERVTRGIIFDPGDGSVAMTDMIRKASGPIRWAAVTKAAPKIEGKRVILEQGGKRLVLTQLAPANVPWEEYSLKPATEAEEQNEGYHLIGFTVPPSGDSTALGVSWKLE